MSPAIAASVLGALLVGALAGGVGHRALSAARSVMAAAERDLAQPGESDLASTSRYPVGPLSI